MKKIITLFSLLAASANFAQPASSTNQITFTHPAPVDSLETIPKAHLSLDPLENASGFSGRTDQRRSPYEWQWVRDGIWTGAGIGASAVGLMLIKKKDDMPLAERDAFLNGQSLQKKIDNINFMDRWVAGKHNKSANNLSDIPFALSFAAPFAFLFDDEINDHTGQYIGLYIESLATTAAIYTITAGLVDRSRPYVYDNSGDTSEDRRFKNNGQRSFYSGHVAATATATFFAAKAYSDFQS